MQRYELDAWLGDDHGLDAEQIDRLLGIAEQIGQRYPDRDDAEEREAALTVAYRILRGESGVVDGLAAELARHRLGVARATAGLRQAALMTVVPGSRGDDSEAAYGRRAGVDRMTVRSWLGK